MIARKHVDHCVAHTREVRDACRQAGVAGLGDPDACSRRFDLRPAEVGLGAGGLHLGVGGGDVLLPRSLLRQRDCLFRRLSLCDRRIQSGLDMIQAASLTMAVETAYRYIDWLGVADGQTLLVNGGGTVIGFAAVQIGLMRGARVIATAGESQAERLRALGAIVTPYGEGMVERVRAIAGAPDLVFDTAPLNMRPDLGPPGGVLPELVAIAGGDPKRVMTCGDFAGAAALGVRMGNEEAPGGPDGTMLRYDMLRRFAGLAAEGRFSIPIASTFPLTEWRKALDISLSGRAHGKLVLVMN